MSRPDYLNMKSSTSETIAMPADAMSGDRMEYSTVAVDGRKVLRNTYMLLSMTLLFSAAVAGTSMALNLPHPGLILTLVGYFGLLFAVHKTKDSAMGIVSVFGLTGFMGYTLGPILSAYASIPGGTGIITSALATTGLIFFGMSAWVLSTGKDLSGWGKTLMVGVLVAFVLSLGAFFFEMPALSLAVSGLFVILMSGMIAWETSNILHGGESNYIMATVSLYVSLYNLFVSLLQIFGVLGSDD
ncbi:Bax inhibitor-1/YccA family protein [Oceanospirillaceae bacterium G-43]|uniref:Bax inhibitor-1/YccA family protein n=2 Tax=Parathalassolituus penaei TaxID=2997323 RepID=A0A9X3IQW2_9GAMM|nr:Bax inhibitor-1/YccA family protein [Parathalassolituus penaei]MCY0963605.1 Bax inhibitor-1/YccA family protein [Parathalassolituus penaei]